MKKYTNKRFHTSVYDLGEGRVRVVYEDPPADHGDAYMLALWSVNTVKEILSHYPGKPAQILSEMSGIPLRVDARTRAVYQDFMESDSFDRLAYVSGVQAFTRLQLIKILLLRHREYVQHFSRREDALRWLGWDASFLR